MTCLTSEQLAAFALDPDAAEIPSHVDECAACQAKLADIRSLAANLVAAHAQFDRRHDVSRAQLLANLPASPPTSRPAATWKRVAFGGLGLSSAAALILLAVFATASTKISAMERMLSAVREVTSYSFNTVNNTTYLAPDGKPQRIRREIGFTCWRAPDEVNKQWHGDLHAEFKSWQRPSAYGEANNPVDERLALHLVETYPTGKPGIIIVYTEGFYFWVPPTRAGYVPVDNSIAKLRAVQQGQGKVLSELGTKQIDGREARGYVLSFEDAVPFRDFGPVEVWVDPQTDLPMELSYKWNKETDKYVDEYRLTDIRWNIDFRPDQFATVAPDGLINTTPPTDENDIAQIIGALKLYADLSGGHYPRVLTCNPNKRRDPAIKTDPPNLFERQLVHDEMLKLAGFTGPPQKDWDRDPNYRQIESATPGLDWLTRVLLDYTHAGFVGAEVTPQDNDKILLWWCAGLEDAYGVYNVDGFYRVFFGDLRSEIVPAAKMAELVPSAFP